MPIVLPSPAAPITSPISSVVWCSQPGSGCCRSRKAMNIVRNPESIRSPALQRSANTTSGGTRNFFRSPDRRDRELARRGVGPRGEQHREDRRAGEDDERVAQRPLRPEASRPAPANGAEITAPDDAGQRDPAVRLDQGEPRRLEPGDGRGPGDAVRLGADEHPERGREHRERLGGHRVGHQPAQERPDGHRGPDRPAPAVAEPVQERAEQGSDDREGQHRQSRGTTPPARAPRPGWAKNRVPASEIATAASPAALKACSSISR